MKLNAASVRLAVVLLSEVRVAVAESTRTVASWGCMIRQMMSTERDTMLKRKTAKHAAAKRKEQQ